MNTMTLIAAISTLGKAAWQRACASGFLGVLFCAAILSCGVHDGEKREARNELIRLAANINRDATAVLREVDTLARFTEGIYRDADAILPTVDTSKYRMAENGAFYKAVDNGKSALWVSGSVPVNEAIRRIAYFTEAQDEALEQIVRSVPAVVQAYYNDRHSVNRIYPPFDVLSQYPSKMDITAFSFYYLADEENNPKREAVWVDVPYVDPAGRGWMFSAIAPVYVKDELAGVAGLDVTVDVITEQYMPSDSTSVMLLDRRGVVVSADERIVDFFGLPPLQDHKYLETVKGDYYRADDYNLLKSKTKSVRALAHALLKQDVREFPFSHRGRKYVVLAEPVTSLNWTAITVVER